MPRKPPTWCSCRGVELRRQLLEVGWRENQSTQFAPHPGRDTSPPLRRLFIEEVCLHAQTQRTAGAAAAPARRASGWNLVADLVMVMPMAFPMPVMMRIGQSRGTGGGKHRSEPRGQQNLLHGTTFHATIRAAASNASQENCLRRGKFQNGTGNLKKTRALSRKAAPCLWPGPKLRSRPALEEGPSLRPMVLGMSGGIRSILPQPASVKAKRVHT